MKTAKHVNEVKHLMNQKTNHEKQLIVELYKMKQIYNLSKEVQINIATTSSTLEEKYSLGLVRNKMN